MINISWSNHTNTCDGQRAMAKSRKSAENIVLHKIPQRSTLIFGDTKFQISEFP